MDARNGMLWFESAMFPTGSCIWILGGPQLVGAGALRTLRRWGKAWGRGLKGEQVLKVTVRIHPQPGLPLLPDCYAPHRHSHKLLLQQALSFLPWAVYPSKCYQNKSFFLSFSDSDTVTRKVPNTPIKLFSFLFLSFSLPFLLSHSFPSFPSSKLLIITVQIEFVFWSRFRLV